MDTRRPFYLFHSQNNPTESRGTGPKGDPNRALSGPLISVAGEQERIPSQHPDRFQEVVVLQATGLAEFLYMDNTEIIADS